MKRKTNLSISVIVDEAIKGEEEKISRLEEFLKDFPLDTPVNKTVALELSWAIKKAEDQIETLKNRKNSI